MLGNKIKQLREEKNITQANLAKLLDVSPSTVGMWEQNRRTPDIEILKKLSDILNVSVDYLLGKTDVRNYLEDPNITIALHSDETSLDYSDLSDEAKKEVQDFIEYVRHKYKDK